MRGSFLPSLFRQFLFMELDTSIIILINNGYCAVIVERRGPEILLISHHPFGDIAGNNKHSAFLKTLRNLQNLFRCSINLTKKTPPETGSACRWTALKKACKPGRSRLNHSIKPEPKRWWTRMLAKKGNLFLAISQTSNGKSRAFPAAEEIWWCLASNDVREDMLCSCSAFEKRYSEREGFVKGNCSVIVW